MTHTTINWFELIYPALRALKAMGVSVHVATSRTLNFVGRDEWNGERVADWVRKVYEEK